MFGFVLASMFHAVHNISIDFGAHIFHKILCVIEMSVIGWITYLLLAENKETDKLLVTNDMICILKQGNPESW